MKTFNKLFCIVLALCFMLSFAACTANVVENNEEDPTPNNDVAESENNAADDTASAGFKVTVVDESGAPVEGVMLQICKENCIPASTDAEGIATFNIEASAEHKLSVLTLPEGYEYNGEAEIYLEDGMTETTVTVTKVA
ncbi:MAG: Ig-like domain-containing protein [Clostridia bacterium]|nr:Ig-like domain-containing protein [Clostridia bacterium]